MIGTISLNLSFVLYLILYFPQIIHNRNPQSIQQLSLMMHLLLYVSYCLDLVYGFSSQLPWQYNVVSFVGIGLITTQHVQIIIDLKRRHQPVHMNYLIIIFLLILFSLLCFFSFMHARIDTQITAAIGYLSRLLFVIYIIPQLIKNNAMQSAQAISVYSIYLNLTLACLDTISAWSLNWGWPNKLSAPLIGLLMLTLLMQTRSMRLNRNRQIII